MRVSCVRSLIHEQSGLVSSFPLAARANPDGLIGTASRPDAGGQIEIESADDFLLDGETAISGGTFTGLLPSGTDATNIQNVVVEIYRVFPLNSTNPPSGNVPTRTNSPSDVAFASRDASVGEVMFSTSTLNPTFTVGNSVVTGINPLPNVFTGERSGVRARGATRLQLPESAGFGCGTLFLRPAGSALKRDLPVVIRPKPIVTPERRSLRICRVAIRNKNLAPDWLRIGTDITHQGPFNAAFSLDGFAVPEPASWTLMLFGFAALGLAFRRGRRAQTAAQGSAGLGLPSTSNA